MDSVSDDNFECLQKDSHVAEEEYQQARSRMLSRIDQAIASVERGEGIPAEEFFASFREWRRKDELHEFHESDDPDNPR